jgi:NADPH:quinone reductase
MKAIPSTMEAAVILKYGGADELKPQRVPVPEPGARQVLIEIHAAGVGAWDAVYREGAWSWGFRSLPLILGNDGAGIVVKTGARVPDFKVGDPVYAYGFKGFYAEYAVADANHVGHIPKHMTFLTAAAASATGLTALKGVEDVVKLRPGETILIWGASGGLGTMAVQFAKALGATVIATASGKDAQELVLKLGSDRVIDARSKDGIDQLKQFAPNGIDAALVLAGGSTRDEYLDFVRPRGRIVYPYGVKPAPRCRRLRVKVAGYSLTAGKREMERMTSLASDIPLQVPIVATFPLEEAAQAHKRIEQGHLLGRIVLITKAGFRDQHG